MKGYSLNETTFNCQYQENIRLGNNKNICNKTLESYHENQSIEFAPTHITGNKIIFMTQKELVVKVTSR